MAVRELQLGRTTRTCPCFGTITRERTCTARGPVLGGRLGPPRRSHARIDVVHRDTGGVSTVLRETWTFARANAQGPLCRRGKILMVGWR